MELKVIRQDDHMTHLALSGRLDLNAVEEIGLKFTATAVSRRKPTLIDISEVEYIASLGLRMLLTAAKSLDRYGVKMMLLSPQPDVEEVLKTVGFDKIMPVEHEKERALEVLKLS